jgi:hypothetical protein
MEVLLGLGLKDGTTENLSMRELMDNVGKTAEEKGLTPEILNPC